MGMWFASGGGGGGTAFTGGTTTTPILAANGSAGAPSYSFTNGTGFGMYLGSGYAAIAQNGGDALGFSSGPLVMTLSGGVFCWTSNFVSVPDTGLSRISAALVGLGNGTAGDFSGTLKSASTVLGATNGAAVTTGFNTELLTLSTGGTTTDTVGNLLPANSIIDSVVARVTTTITTATSWQLGDATTAGRFTAANATMTAGTTDFGKVHLTTGIASATTGMYQTAASKVRVTTVGTPGAGAIRITVFFRTFTAPTS